MYKVLISILTCCVWFGYTQQFASPSNEVTTDPDPDYGSRNNSEAKLGRNFDLGDNTIQERLLQNQLGGNNGDPFFCGPLQGRHYMIGSQTFCGGFSVNDCSAACFFKNFTYFQCNGNICHCHQ